MLRQRERNVTSYYRSYFWQPLEDQGEDKVTLLSKYYRNQQKSRDRWGHRHQSPRQQSRCNTVSLLSAAWSQCSAQVTLEDVVVGDTGEGQGRVCVCAGDGDGVGDWALLFRRVMKHEQFLWKCRQVMPEALLLFTTDADWLWRFAVTWKKSLIGFAWHGLPGRAWLQVHSVRFTWIGCFCLVCEDSCVLLLTMVAFLQGCNSLH